MPLSECESYAPLTSSQHLFIHFYSSSSSCFLPVAEQVASPTSKCEFSALKRYRAERYVFVWCNLSPTFTQIFGNLIWANTMRHSGACSLLYTLANASDSRTMGDKWNGNFDLVHFHPFFSLSFSLSISCFLPFWTWFYWMFGSVGCGLGERSTQKSMSCNFRFDWNWMTDWRQRKIHFHFFSPTKWTNQERKNVRPQQMSFIPVIHTKLGNVRLFFCVAFRKWIWF